ncbi:hypothetical protein AV530_002453 [Patagioenas fasciata monilis]|uniref:Uncharacterized protein n=1 Tax=Patagioenas fasciata monilis TaxID=372326 RepID=A0A1V4K6E9_PATFA|nr:hypothetical protein AV530_002453 [Patagioenas fasciata monilis]
MASPHGGLAAPLRGPEESGPFGPCSGSASQEGTPALAIAVAAFSAITNRNKLFKITGSANVSVWTFSDG